MFTLFSATQKRKKTVWGKCKPGEIPGTHKPRNIGSEKIIGRIHLTLDDANIPTLTLTTKGAQSTRQTDGSITVVPYGFNRANSFTEDIADKKIDQKKWQLSFHGSKAIAAAVTTCKRLDWLQHNIMIELIKALAKWEAHQPFPALGKTPFFDLLSRKQKAQILATKTAEASC